MARKTETLEIAGRTVHVTPETAERWAALSPAAQACASEYYEDGLALSEAIGEGESYQPSLAERRAAHDADAARPAYTGPALFEDD